MTNQTEALAKRLDEFLSQFDEEEQERIIRYALDHIAPKLKARAAIRQAAGVVVKAEMLGATGHCLQLLESMNDFPIGTKFYAQPPQVREQAVLPALECARDMILSEPTSQPGWIAKEDAAQHVSDAIAAVAQRTTPAAQEKQ